MDTGANGTGRTIVPWYEVLFYVAMYGYIVVCALIAAAIILWFIWRIIGP